jgi:hypothetical protein
MTAESTTPALGPQIRRRKLIAGLAVGLVVVGSAITAGSVSAVNYSAETERLCALALKDEAKAADAASASVAKADAAISSVAAVQLPGGGVSSAYADRPSVVAVEEAGGVEEIVARDSGLELTGAVQEGRDALAALTFDAVCVDREQLTTVALTTGSIVSLSAFVDDSVIVLTDDFAAFQADEDSRIAAEIEVARVAAEVEAARVAAVAAEASRVSAEQAAAARAAAQVAAPKVSNSGSGSSSGGSTVRRGSSGTPGGGGGGVGLGTGDGTGCRVDNGMGGFFSC